VYIVGRVAMTATEWSDRDLFLKWHGGDAKAGEVLFERHFDSIYRFFETKCPNEADELVQATFLACLRGRDAFRHDASFRTYLFAIARNQLYGFLRARQRDRVVDFELSSIAELASTAGSKLARHEQHQQLLAALRSLPLEAQTLLELHYMQDMQIAELAEVFEAPAVTIRSRLHRARKQLRELLEKNQDVARSVVETLESMDEWGKEQVKQIVSKA
jgi:RNA polymerase sigma-70 factor (ECF subfamily)